jgi:hypothetical protein
MDVMSADVLGPARVSHRLAAVTTAGLWRAITDRVRATDSLPTVEVADLGPRQSMFDYDPADAVVLTDLPDRI